ncbi:MAG TPA: branched chain amino acid aminotransferase, partial [Cytophagales bacterium]|nr:branched chain amino acid aminotransferase [Cytophagales bacterium]
MPFIFREILIMTETQTIAIQRTAASRLAEVDFATVPFGKVFADHMFIADFRNGEWKNLRIIPYGHLPMSPATPAIHYGQAIFEGMKAFRGGSGEINLFRPLDNWKRLNISAQRMCLAQVPEEIFMDGLTALITLDRQWVPSTPGGSLYIRPFLF